MSTNNTFNLEDPNNSEITSLLKINNNKIQINESMAKKYKHASKHLEYLTDDWIKKQQITKYKTSIHFSVQKNIKALNKHVLKLGQKKKNNTQDNLDFLKGKERDYRIGIKATNDLQKLINKHYIPVDNMTLKLNNNEFTITDLLKGPTESNTSVMKGYKTELTRLVDLYEEQKNQIITENNKIQEKFTNSIRDYLLKIIEFKATKLNIVETKLNNMLRNSDLILDKLQKKLVELINSISNENITNNNLKKSNTQKPVIKLSQKSNENLSKVEVKNEDLIHKLYENYQQIKTNTNLVKKEQEFIQKINSNLLYLKKTSKNNPENYEKQIVDLVRNYFGEQELNAYKTALNKYTVNETNYPINKTNIINTSILSSWQYYSTLLDFRIKKAQDIFQEVIKMCKKLTTLITKLEKSKISINKFPAKNLITTKQYLENIKIKYEEMEKLTMKNCLNMNQKLQSLNIATYLSAIEKQLPEPAMQPPAGNTLNGAPAEAQRNTGLNSNEKIVEGIPTISTNESPVPGEGNFIINSPNNPTTSLNQAFALDYIGNEPEPITQENFTSELNFYNFIYDHLYTSTYKKEKFYNIDNEKIVDALFYKDKRNGAYNSVDSILDNKGKVRRVAKKNELPKDIIKRIMKRKNVLIKIINDLDAYDENKKEKHKQMYIGKKIKPGVSNSREYNSGYIKNLRSATKQNKTMNDRIDFAFENKNILKEFLEKALKSAPIA